MKKEKKKNNNKCEACDVLLSKIDEVWNFRMPDRLARYTRLKINCKIYMNTDTLKFCVHNSELYTFRKRRILYKMELHNNIDKRYSMKKKKKRDT